jgi:ADP-heptose:LPS heptosyltransferase
MTEKTVTQSPVGAGAERNILVIKLGALGDVALAMPHIAAIQAAFPRDRVILLTAPAYAPLAAALPGLEIASFPRRGFLPMARLLRWLLARQFRVVYDLQGSLRSRIMTLLTQAETRVGKAAGIAYTCAALPAGHVLHAAEGLNRLLEAGGIVPPGRDFHLPVAPAVAAGVEAWLQRQGLQGKSLVLVHAGSSPRWPSKRWPAGYYRELALALAARGLQVVWLGAASDRELNRTLASATGTDASGAFSFPELVALARRSAFAITNDSGPMHILAGAGLPVFACFGPTDWRRSHATGQANRVLTATVPCSPCRLPLCPPQYRHACMQDMTPDQVLARLEAAGVLKVGREM